MSTVAHARNYTVRLKRPHSQQQAFISSGAKRKIIRAGRRAGKTTWAATLAVERFLDRSRILYATPTVDQVDRFWTEIKLALAEPIDGKVFYKNETEHLIEIPNTETRIRAKTAWNADTLRGDYADLLILDEWQLMDEDAWEVVGAPMLMDNNGDAVFIYTPASLRSRSVSKARDPLHAARMYKQALLDKSGRWAAFTFPSSANPFLSPEALKEVAQDMTSLAYRQEILAEDVEEMPGALWQRAMFNETRHRDSYQRIVVAIDPSVTSSEHADECGIIVAGKAYDGHGYVLDDKSLRASPEGWARVAINAYHQFKADCIVAESNNGGEMVRLTLGTVDPNVPVKLVQASRGKQIRAEPIAALYEQKKVWHTQSFLALEDQLCLWTPDSPSSSDRLDSLVWAMSELMLGGRPQIWV